MIHYKEQSSRQGGIGEEIHPRIRGTKLRAQNVPSTYGPRALTKTENQLRKLTVFTTQGPGTTGHLYANKLKLLWCHYSNTKTDPKTDLSGKPKPIRFLEEHVL